MKTFIKTLFATTLSLVVLTSATFATPTAKNNQLTVLNQVKNIKKITVSGNVELILVQASTESVKVYDNYYSKNALVQQQDNDLRISSFEKEPLTIAVYVRDLSTIEASGTSTIKTFGKVNFLSLDVILHDKASADINASTTTLYTSIKDNATLKLSGNTNDHTALLGSFAKMSMDQFTADTTFVSSVAPTYAKRTVVQASALQSL